jgi:hypothetical protein
VDVALLGVRDPGFTGVSDLAIVHFRALAVGDPALQVAAASGRSSSNAVVPIQLNTLQAPRALPARTELSAILPTPSPGSATMRFALARGGRVMLAIHGVDGRRVRVLADGEREPGEYSIGWDGRDGAGHPAAPGVYYVRFEAPGARFTRRLVLVR